MFSPPPVYTPPPPPNPATPADAKVQAAGVQQRQGANALGYGSTIMTSPSGLDNSSANTGNKTLTGQ